MEMSNPRLIDEKNRSNKKNKDAVKAAAGLAATESAKIATDQAAQTFAKPNSYTGNRQMYDSGAAKKGVKLDAFDKGTVARDPYTGEKLVLRKADAKQLYGEDWAKHLAEGDHITPLEKIFNDNKNNPWLKNSDIKDIANSADNMQVVSRQYNNAKRSRSNEEFVNDSKYLKKTGVELTEEGKANAIKAGKNAEAVVSKSAKVTTIENIVETGHNAGKAGAMNAGAATATMSGIMNIVSVIKGEKSVEEALADTAVDAGKAAATGYVMGGGLTTVCHTLSASSSSFLKALSDANVPGKIITAVVLTGNTLKQYLDGEISTQECLIEIGEKGLNMAMTGYSMAVGQALIPIPIVGAAVGALVGSIAASTYCNKLMDNLKRKELEHQERLRIIEECKRFADQTRALRAELESYLDSYFKEYKSCFDEALSEIHIAFQMGDADRIIDGANQITRKLGGKVYFENSAETRQFLNNGLIDVL